MISRLRYPLIAGLGLICSMAAASGLQIMPIPLKLLSTQRSDGLWLSNSGGSAVRVQVRLYRWTQEGGEDKLTPTTALTVSPPMLQVAAGGRHLVRVIRLGAPPSGPGAVQEAYRMVIDELPSSATDGTVKQGVQFKVDYSVPVFVEPAGPAAAPNLSWAIRTEGDKAVLEVSNSGAAHAKLGKMSFIDAAGQRAEVSAGLLGYVLPGAHMRWGITLAPKVFANGGTLEAVVNAQPIQEVIPPTHAAH
ncbi:pilus assembly protein [Polaromonas sp.]|nr:pilus assembly protein [Polaromonas sp.]